MGTINTTITHEVTLSASGTYSSPLTITTSGAVEADAGAAIFGPATQAWTIINAGIVTNSLTQGNGIELDAGGAVTNQAGGTITAHYGVLINGTAGSVTNAGYIHGTTVGVNLAAGGTVINNAGGTIGPHGTAYSVPGNGVLLDNGGTAMNQAGGTITGNLYAIRVRGAAGSVSNAGYIGHTDGSFGVELEAGGKVTNQAGGTIVAAAFGVYFHDASSTLINAGTVTDTHTGEGVRLAGGGTIINQNGGVISGFNFGIFVRNAPGYVINAGTIVGTGSAGAVNLRSGGTVVNQTDGVIAGPVVGVVSYATGTVTNTGRISGGSFGVYLFAGGGQVTNQSGGTITGTSHVGVFIKGGDGTVTNAGTISGSSGGTNTGTYRGVSLDGGTTTNKASGVISGRQGVYIGQTSGSVTNAGYIQGSGGSLGVGVSLAAGGTVTNQAGGTIAGARGVSLEGGTITNEAGGVITGDRGIYIGQTSGSVINAGYIKGSSSAVALASVGGVTNQAGGTIHADFTAVVLLGSGTVVNQAGGTISGIVPVLFQYTSGTLTNAGMLQGSDVGVRLTDGGAVTNQAGGTISGFNLGIDLRGAPGYVTNAGYIVATGQAAGINLLSGTVVNQAGGTIASLAVGIEAFAFPGDVAGPVTVTNAGTVSGRYGIYLSAGGVVTNQIGGRIEGTSYVGIVIAGGDGTVANAATIIGPTSGDAVRFVGSFTNRLVVEPGATFTGGVVGGSGNDTLELGGSGGALTVDYNALALTNFENVLFGTGNNATLRVSNTSGTLGVTISGFDATTETIDLTAIGTDGTITAFDTANDRITVTGSGGSVTLEFDSIDGIPFTTAPDSAGGTNLSIACFCRGTRITTPTGETPVEALAIGDRVMTISGESKPIKWVGKRAYDPRFVAGNRNVLPIRIEADALAHGVPARDLFVSPEHALYLRQVLVPAQLLVNDATITQPESVDRLEYFHIDLGTHDVILAEGAAAETYVDCDNRGMFNNEREFARLYPGEMPPRWEFCARRIEEGALELAAIRRGVLARAKVYGRFTDDPDLHLVVDGTAVPPQLIANRRLYRFTLPAGSRSIVLASRSTVPMKIEISPADGRRLGVAVERIVLRGTGRSVEIGADCPSLCNGFHDAELGFRWTDGRGQLPAGLSAAFRGDIVMEVHLAETEAVYGLETPAAAIKNRAMSKWHARSALPRPRRAAAR